MSAPAVSGTGGRRTGWLLRGLLAAALAAPCGQAQGIVMRHDVPAEEYRSDAAEWPATAFFHIGGRFGAGAGTLVAPGWVLTAAHVAHHLAPGDPVTIRGVSYAIRHVELHPGYVLMEPGDDIALVRLSREVEDVAPALPYARKDETGRVVTFVGAGWPGTGITGASGGPGTIRAAENRVEATRGDLVVFRFDAPPDALPREGISGPGDSGGPAYLVREGKVFTLGVSAYQGPSPTGVEGVYGVDEFYTRVSAYEPWIRSVIGDDTGKSQATD